MSQRRLDDWLQAYLSYTDNTECPERYHYWVGVSVLSMVMRRKVYTTKGHVTFFPNFYVFLVSPPGRDRKSLALEIGERLLTRVGVPLCGDASTRENILVELSAKKSLERKPDPSPNLGPYPDRPSHVMGVVSSELGVFLAQEIKRSPAFLDDLCRLYDCAPRFSYETKGSGDYVSWNTWFGMLGASTPARMTTMLPEEAIGGGFMSRVMLIGARGKRKRYSYFAMPEVDKKLETALIHDLIMIEDLQGEMIFEKEAMDFYNTWYQSLDDESPTIDDLRFYAYWQRKPTHLLKLSMILSASRRDTKIVTLKDIEEAYVVMNKTEEFMASCLSGTGITKGALQTHRLLEQIRAAGSISHTELMRRNLQMFEPRQFNEAIDGLVAAGVVKRVYPQDGEAKKARTMLVYVPRENVT